MMMKNVRRVIFFALLFHSFNVAASQLKIVFDLWVFDGQNNQLKELRASIIDTMDMVTRGVFPNLSGVTSSVQVSEISDHDCAGVFRQARKTCIGPCLTDRRADCVSGTDLLLVDAPFDPSYDDGYKIQTVQDEEMSASCSNPNSHRILVKRTQTLCRKFKQDARTYMIRNQVALGVCIQNAESSREAVQSELEVALKDSEVRNIVIISHGFMRSAGFDKNLIERIKKGTIVSSITIGDYNYNSYAAKLVRETGGEHLQINSREGLSSKLFAFFAKVSGWQTLVAEGQVGSYHQFSLQAGASLVMTQLVKTPRTDILDDMPLIFDDVQRREGILIAFKRGVASVYSAAQAGQIQALYKTPLRSDLTYRIDLVGSKNPEILKIKPTSGIQITHLLTSLPGSQLSGVLYASYEVRNITLSCTPSEDNFPLQQCALPSDLSPGHYVFTPSGKPGLLTHFLVPDERDPFTSMSVMKNCANPESGMVSAGRI